MSMVITICSCKCRCFHSIKQTMFYASLPVQCNCCANSMWLTWHCFLFLWFLLKLTTITMKLSNTDTNNFVFSIPNCSNHSEHWIFFEELLTASLSWDVKIDSNKQQQQILSNNNWYRNNIEFAMNVAEQNTANKNTQRQREREN